MEVNERVRKRRSMPSCLICPGRLQLIKRSPTMAQLPPAAGLNDDKRLYRRAMFATGCAHTAARALGAGPASASASHVAALPLYAAILLLQGLTPNRSTARPRNESDPCSLTVIGGGHVNQRRSLVKQQKQAVMPQDSGDLAS